MHVPSRGEEVIVLTNDGEKRGTCKGQKDTWHGETYYVKRHDTGKKSVFHYEDIKEAN